MIEVRRQNMSPLAAGDVVTVERKEHKRPLTVCSTSTPFLSLLFLSLLTLALRDNVSPKMDAQKTERDEVLRGLRSRLSGYRGG